MEEEYLTRPGAKGLALLAGGYCCFCPVGAAISGKLSHCSSLRDLSRKDSSMRITASRVNVRGLLHCATIFIPLLPRTSLNITVRVGVRVRGGTNLGEMGKHPLEFSHITTSQSNVPCREFSQCIHLTSEDQNNEHISP